MENCKERYVKTMRWLLSALLCATIAHATVNYPGSVAQPVQNLEHYLEYLFDDAMDFVCTESGREIRCVEKDFNRTETDENNATVQTRFERLELFFDKSVLPYFEKVSFDAAMAEYRAAEKVREKERAGGKKVPKPVPTPLKDAMDRALWSKLDKMVLKNLRVDVSKPKAHTAVGEIVYENAMKTSDGNASYSERVFGTMSLRYKDFVAVSEDAADSAYVTLAHRLESWLETNDTVRADYVGKRLQHIYADRMTSPSSGSLILATAYRGEDTLSLKIHAVGNNARGDRSLFSFDSEVHRLSSLIPPKEKDGQAKGKEQGGMPDFLFLSMDFNSTIHNGKYRDLLKNDSRFRGYIMEYDRLIGAHYDDAVKTYGQNPVVAKWFKGAKEALSKMIRAEAERFGVSVRNRTGATAMQLVGMVIGQLALMGKKGTDTQKEKIILDTAAQHLDIRIEAK